jgi:hypothetical protein
VVYPKSLNHGKLIKIGPDRSPPKRIKASCFLLARRGRADLPSHRVVATLTAVTGHALAHKLGTTRHFSPLLRKARRLGLTAPQDLWTLAVQRGCRHYWQGNEPDGELVSQEAFPNEELAIALLDTAGTYSPHSIRCGAAMVGALGNDPEMVARLAITERSEAVVRYIAEWGKKYEPENPYWENLLLRLPACEPPKDGVMPHPTRFVAMSGYQRGVGKLVKLQWQRPKFSDA